VIVLDGSVLIAYLDGDDRFHSRARAELTACAAQPFRASAVTMAEVLVRPTQVGDGDVANRVMAALGLSAVAIDVDAPARLAALRVKTRLKMPDCCVLLAAEDVRAHTVLSFDDRLRQAAQDAGYAVDPS
jgi:predicted nucleic acid-binding protein